MLIKLSTWAYLEVRMAGGSDSMKTDNIPFGKGGTVQIFVKSLTYLLT